jgi:hypothetical protein
MLLGAIDHVQRAGGDTRTFFGKLYGQEKNLTTSSIARMNLPRVNQVRPFARARRWSPFRSTKPFSGPETGRC